MKRTPFFVLILLALSFNAVSQRKAKSKKSNVIEVPDEGPRLVVGIVVDQMRYDYLTRFWGHYGNGGFKRLVAEGFNCKNHHFNYAPTSTGPGHASVFTGTTPAVHGIIGNDWYDKESESEVYVAGDAAYEGVGTTGEAGKMSPHRMLTTTITDQNRLHTQMRGKTIAVAIKDRGAVLPGGHTANAAFWFEGGDVGKWISSTYYMDALPEWATAFNASGIISGYKKPWTTFHPIASYVESGPDDNPYESLFEDEQKPIFPHQSPNLLNKAKDFEILKYTAHGNSLTLDFALAALAGENLGKDEDTDFLTISFSSTDYIGHKFGVNSKEIQDTYVRLDRDIERLLNTLDAQVGKGRYTLFLTADHGAIHVPAYLKDQRIPAGYLDFKALRERFDAFLKYKYGTTDIVKTISNYQVFLDHKVIDNLDMDLDDVQEEMALEMLRYDVIDKVFTGNQMWQQHYSRSSGIPFLIQQGWHQKRSGDVIFVQRPGYVSYPRTGSTHGSPMIYDTHVPLLFFGNGIRQGATTTRTEIPDIAPTVSVLLGAGFPNGTTGSVIDKALVD